MKLRLLGNSIRIRIQQNELATLEGGGAIKEEVSFGPSSEQVFIYTLVPSSTLDEIDARFEDGRVSVFIPYSAVQEMAKTDRVGFARKKTLDGTKSLSILIEKDFKCLTPRAEDDDAFPYPNSEQSVC